MDFLTPDSLPLNLQTAIAYRDLAAGQTLFHQGDQALAIYWVESGRIRLTDYTKDGQTINHYILRAHESFAEAALFSDIYECTAIADLTLARCCFAKTAFSYSPTRSLRLIHSLHGPASTTNPWIENPA